MLIDHKIIARHGALQVLAQRHMLSWPDGSELQIHPVWSHGLPQTFFRALPTEGGGFLIFDVARLAPELAADLRQAPPRDQVGMVFFSMRRHFASADALRAAVRPIATAVAVLVDAKAADLSAGVALQEAA